MALVWTLIATSLLSASSVATLLTTLHLRCRWDVHASSVRWLFWCFFLCVFIWCFFRAIFFSWLCSFSDVERSDNADAHLWSYSQLDRLGVHGVLYLKESTNPWLTAVLVLGDIGLFGIALTLFPLTYELSRLAKLSMDRGIQKEHVQIRRYMIAIDIGLVLYGITQLVLTLVHGGYNKVSQRCVLGVYALQFVAFAYMAVTLIRLKVDGRDYETIQGTFVLSPVYMRLKRIMLAHSMFAVQFQLSMLIINFYGVPPKDSGILDYVGVSMWIYDTSGLALSITTSCSQACIFSACGPCLPDNFEAEFMRQKLTVPTDDDIEAPRTNPIFVYTDIQSSTALWNVNGGMMSAATEIHDNILRTSLPKHHGYEITTVGDAFQVAFRTIGDAVSYCLNVQLQLLTAKWPKELHDVIPATKRERAHHRVIFNGLRVRMGIHDASEQDGVLVQDVHAVTGKATYVGTSEIIAEYVGDLGSGGQILVTDRVAAWLRHHRSELSVDVFMEYVGLYTVPQINTPINVYQLLPTMLAARAEHFPKPPKEQPAQRQRGGSGRIMHARLSSAHSVGTLSREDLLAMRTTPPLGTVFKTPRMTPPHRPLKREMQSLPLELALAA